MRRQQWQLARPVPPHLQPFVPTTYRLQTTRAQRNRVYLNESGPVAQLVRASS